MTKKQLYGIETKDYLVYLKIAEIKAKIDLLESNYQTNYASRNQELSEEEQVISIEIQRLRNVKKEDLKKWLKILDNSNLNV